MPYGNLGWNLRKLKFRSAGAATIYINVFYEGSGSDTADSVNTSYTLTAETSATWATVTGGAAEAGVRGFTVRCSSSDVYVAEQSVATPNGIKIPAGVEMSFGDCS